VRLTSHLLHIVMNSWFLIRGNFVMNEISLIDHHPDRAAILQNNYASYGLDL
jgi:hypothetical protein